MAEGVGVGRPSGSLRKILVPLALAQFICSFAGSNMNVMITDISKDLDTTVQGVQIAITVFLLVMAALMIPGGKLTDRWGRKRCFTLGLTIYGIGALMSAVSPGLGVLILGNSIFEGVGTALLIPPVYILTTLLFTDITSRARAFGVITGMGGVGAAAGPLIGGLITTAISWRAAFVFQALVIAVIVLLSRSIVDPVAPDPTRPFDTLGAVLSAAGLVLVVMGVLAADNNLLLMAVLLVVGAVVLGVFFVHIRGLERKRRGAVAVHCTVPKPNVEPRTRHPERAVAAADRNRVRRLGVPPGRSWLQRHPNRRDLHRRDRRHLWCRRSPPSDSPRSTRSARSSSAGFVTTIVGVVVLLALVKGSPSAWAFAPGLLLIGLGVGVMLTPSVNVVQSRVRRGATRRDLGPVALHLQPRLVPRHRGRRHHPRLRPHKTAYGAAMIALALIGIIGLVAAMLLPAQRVRPS